MAASSCHPVDRSCGSGETMRIVERFTRVGDQMIECRCTIEDPMVYLTPYGAALPDQRRQLPDDGVGVSRGELGMKNLLSAARANEKEALYVAGEEARERRSQLEQMRRRTADALKK